MKKILAAAALIVFLASNGSISGQDAHILCFGQLRTDALINSSALINLDRAVKDSWNAYKEALKEAEDINIYGTTREIMGMKVYISYDNYTQMLMTLQKELLPKQLEHVWLTASENRRAALYSLDYSLQLAWLNLWSQYRGFEIKNMKYELSVSEHNASVIKKDMGMITDYGYRESEYTLMAAENEKNASWRSLENSQRSMNVLAGYPRDTFFDDVEFNPEVLVLPEKNDDDYVMEALSQRAEISQLERQIALKQLEKSIYEKKDLHIVKSSVRSDYEDVLFDIEKLELQLEKTKKDIEKDIRNLYIDVLKAQKDLQNLKEALEQQKKALESMDKNYSMGYITRNSLTRMRINVMELENSCIMAAGSLNISYNRLKYECNTAIAAIN